MAFSSKDDSDTFADREVESSISNGHQRNISKKVRRNGEWLINLHSSVRNTVGLNFTCVYLQSAGQSTPSPAPNSSGSSGFSDDDSLPFEERCGLTMLEFVEHVKQKGRRGLLDEYTEIISKNPEGTFNTSR